MASNEQDNTIIKHRSSISQRDIFSWKFEICNQIMEISSAVFDFCGYWCYLKFTSVVCTWTCDGYENLDVIISLHGYPTLFKKNISCQYSLFMKIYKEKLCFNKTGEIHTLKDVVHIILYKGGYRFGDGDLFPCTVYFSWSENEDYEVFSQGMQTEPGSICFSWSENGDCEVYSQGVQTEPEISIPVLERGIQTEGACMSPTSELIDNSEKESYKFLQILSNDFGSLHESTTDPDCVLKLGEVKFPVHRTVLSARSTVFAAMFHHDTSESQSGEVDILDIDGDVFGDVLYYIYTGKIRGLSSATAASMYIVSDKYALIEFRDKCLNYLMHNLNVDNVGDAALLAHAHAEIQLENEIIHFIEENLEELMLNETWIRFSDTHLKLANKLLCSASIAIKKKFQKSHLS